MSLYDAAREFLQHVPAENLDLRRATMDLMNLALKADDEIAVLKRTVSELEQAVEIKESLMLDQGVYWLPKESGPNQGPFCPACWGEGSKVSTDAA